MPADPLAEVLRRLRPADRPDADLVRRFVGGDEAAFEALVRRHGPAVFGVCRRVLRPGPDAEDAFQATFLVLARKAGAVRDPAAVGPWLHGVARNVSRRLRAANARRRAAEAAAPPPAAPPEGDTAVVDDELARLPERYRAALLACARDGRTIRDAAAELGWPPGTVATRLARGRALLARRLARRGVVVPALAVPPTAALLEQTVRAAATGAVPAVVLTLTAEATRAMFVTKVKLASAVVLLAGLGLAAVTAQPPAAQPPAPAKAEPPAPKREPTAASKLIDRLAELRAKGQRDALDDTSAAVLRDLIRLGPAATPDVVAALDSTTDSYMLRCLGFAARAIGDKRAVPALIRALPKACLPSANDYGLISKDPELLGFLQAHSTDKRGGTHYSFGRPINEIRTALQSLTGTTHGEDELVFVSLGGSPRQQGLQREQYRRCAARWAAWWEANARDHVADPAYRLAGFTAPPAELPPTTAEFPRGPRAVVGTTRTNNLLESVRAPAAKHAFLDLDTGRSAALPAKFRPAPGKAERLDDIAAWAAAEGFDLMGTEDGPPGEPHYVIRGLGLTAWELTADRRATLADELKAERVDLGRPTGGLLAPFDIRAGRHAITEPGLFLFRTREGGYGWIFVGVEVNDDTQRAGVAFAGDSELNPVAFRKGRRYGYGLVWERPAE